VPLAFRPSSITWDFSAAPGISPNTLVGPINNPSPDSTTTLNGQNLYFFSNKNSYSFSRPNTVFVRDTVKVYTKTTTPDGCGSSDQTFLIPVKVDPLPSANFTFTNGCLGDSIRFFDATNTNGNSVVDKGLWNFDDGTTDSIKNPVKKFTTEGTYKIRYRPVTSYGCVGDTTIPITFSAPPKAKFGISDTTCLGGTVTFTDSSTTNLGQIAKWIWNFGEGTAITNSTNAAVTHTYKAVGKYTASLEVESNTGCKSVVFTKEIQIYPAPVPDFSFSEACLPNGDVQFTNLTTISDGREAGLRYSWTFGDGGSSLLKSPSHKYGSVGPFDVKLVAISENGCIKEATKQLNTIYPQPKPAFSVDTEVCFNNSTKFKDESTGGNIVKWRWDFGDGTGDTTQNPTYLYPSPKTYTVKLVVFSNKGCVSDTISKTTLVNPLPTADFNTSSPFCENQNIVFTDRSKANAGNISRWDWDFGDGTTASNTNSNPFNKVYKTAGRYFTKLLIETDKGCKTDTTKSITVTSVPVVNFILPEVCLNDAFANFTDSSYIADRSESNFTYNWNFGDGNTSNDKNPKHKYTSVGDYAVTLKVTSKDGCSATAIKAFTVNGSNPVADFTVLNENNLCSNTTVQIRNASVVTPGNITKVEIWWDGIGSPTTFVTDENPVAGEIYSYNYPISASARTYQIKLKAYSGVVCSFETSKQVVINGSPKVLFEPMPAICMNDGPRQITQATETLGVQGNSFYSGKGVSPTGFFNPQLAGAGTSSIKYVYTSSNGCTDSAQQMITVYANPQVNAGPDLFVLEGGSIVINADVKGNELSFNWSPPTYLNNSTIQRPTSTPLADIVYSLTVTGQGACTGKDNVAIKVLLAPTVPNAFSPNNDGINDTWNIEYLETYPGAVIEVFNRYGQRVFISRGYSKAWNGQVNGNPLPAGVYYYIIDPKNGRKALTGSLTILR
jgi:gliding motility-associated-like protein